MEFLDPDKKKKHNQRLFIGYFLLGVAIILSALILFFQSSGYDVDRKTGKIIQNGLIFVSAAPESATVYLNGAEKDKTDTRLTVPAGNYSVELKRDGYRTWKRSFNLEGSSIERLQYPVLFPEKLTQKDVAQYATEPTFTTQSPDRQWIIVLRPDGFANFDVYDANNPKAAAVNLALPAGLLSAGENQKLSLIEWSTDNRHVLLRHDFAQGQYEFIMLDREAPANSLNLNKHLALNPTEITLRDKRFDQLYLFDTATKTLRSTDTKTKQITQVLAGVRAYKSYGDNTLLYAMDDPVSANKAIVKVRDNGKDYTLRSYTDPADFLLDITRFDNRWYVVVGPKNENRVSIYRDPMVANKQSPTDLPQPYSALIMKDTQKISFSANARFILSQSANHFAVYDADTNRRFYYDLALNLTLDQKASWMDGHRLLVSHEGKVVVLDFNGINQQTLVPIQNGTVPYFDREYTRLYTIASSIQSPDKKALTQTPLKLNLQ